MAETFDLARVWRLLPRPEDRGKDKQYYDTKLDGLALRCKATGSRAWRFDFYHGGKRQPITLGAAGDMPPALDFETAKAEYLKAALALQEGRNPAEERRQAKVAPAAAPAVTVREALDRFYAAKLGDHATRKKDGLPLSATAKRDKRSRLDRHLGEPYGSRAITSIVRRDVAAILDAAAATGRASMTKLLQRDLSSFFAFLLSRDEIQASPMPVGEHWGSDRKRERFLSEPELAAVLKGIAAEGYPNRHAFLLLLLTGMRRREVTNGQWSEIDWTGKTWGWASADMRDKMRHGRVKPLSDLAIAVLKDAQKHATGDYILSAQRGKPLASLGSAWTDKGEPRERRDNAQSRIVDRAEKELGGPMAPWRVHDLRHTIRTHLVKVGVAIVTAEACIDHKLSGAAGRYDHHDRLPEMRSAFAMWDALLQSLGLKVEPVKLLAPPASASLAPPQVEAFGC